MLPSAIGPPGRNLTGEGSHPVLLAGQATMGKVDVEAEPAIAERFGVQALPSLLFFKGGERVDTLVGRVPKAVIADRLRALRDSVL